MFRWELTFALVAALLAVPPAAAQSRYSEYVAIGDSYSADVVIAGQHGSVTTEFAPFDCYQSDQNFPRQVARALGVARFRDASCGGAGIDDLTAPQSGVPMFLGGVNPPQFDRLTPTTDLVTVLLGGNDVGIARAAAQCITLNPPMLHAQSCRQAFTAAGSDVMSARIVAAEPKLVAALQAIRARAPKADIFVVNYLAAATGPHTCWPYVPIAEFDQSWLAEKGRELNAMLARAAATAGATLVDTYTPSIGHDFCQSPNVRWVEGLLPVSVNAPALAIPFHPNSAGASAQARAVLAAIEAKP